MSKGKGGRKAKPQKKAKHTRHFDRCIKNKEKQLSKRLKEIQKTHPENKYGIQVKNKCRTVKLINGKKYKKTSKRHRHETITKNT